MARQVRIRDQEISKLKLEALLGVWVEAKVKCRWMVEPMILTSSRKWVLQLSITTLITLD